MIFFEIIYNDQMSKVPKSNKNWFDLQKGLYVGWVYDGGDDAYLPLSLSSPIFNTKSTWIWVSLARAPLSTIFRYEFIPHLGEIWFKFQV